MMRVEVRFRPIGDGTVVTVEHSELERHGDDGPRMRTSVGGQNGWALCPAGYRNSAKGAGDVLFDAHHGR